MLTSHTRSMAAVFVGALSLAACNSGTSRMTPPAQSDQTMAQVNGAAGHCKTLPLTRGKAPRFGCGVRSASHHEAAPQAGKLQVFDVPGAISISECSPYDLFNDCGTFSYGLNTLGTVIGSYLNPSGVLTAFVRTGGNYTSFQAPNGQDTSPFQITNAGAIVGQYSDDNNVAHAFIRSKGGSFLTFDAPWAGQTPNDSVPQGTAAGAINPRGDTNGVYWDAQGVIHGFLRSSEGKFVQVNPKGSVTSSTCIACLNNNGVTAGGYTGSDGIGRGFIRSASGGFRTIAEPGAADTGVTGLNNDNVALAFFVDSNGVVWGLIRGDKKHIVFQDPKASKAYGGGTQPEAINDAGAVTGLYADAQGNAHGFYRSPTGQYVEFDPPGSVFTEPSAISANGTVTGSWYDAQGANHGFTWTSH